MDEDERMARLLSGLASDVKYATGERRFRGAVSADDAAEIAEALARELDAGVEARARAAAKQRFRMACERGCNACCEELVVVFLPEALAVARWLGSAANVLAKEAFLAAYPRWRDAAGDEPDRIAELARKDADRAAYEAAHRAFWRRRILCAFNQDGACTIYPVRPLV
ncbi:MAG TPA: hypothetical protein VMZ28_20160, partial [Kofleriaceae bacterium]|nr:hypothetical protein [Kofleriaceae bacterium]